MSKLRKFSTHVACDHRSSMFSGGVALRYVLPDLCMTTCLHIIAKKRWREKRAFT